MVNYKSIVAKVLKCREEITCKRSDVTKNPSIIRAEFQRERDQLDKFKVALNSNIEQEKFRQK